MMLADSLLPLLVFGFVVMVVIAISRLAMGGKSFLLHARLRALKDREVELQHSVSAIRAQYLRQLPPLERALEQMPGIDHLSKLCAQAGRTEPAYRVALLSLILGISGGVIGITMFKNPLALLFGFVMFAPLPVLKLILDRKNRLQRFEEQLPDALNLMSRALRAGNPLLESFKFIGDEMQEPIASEFRRVWSNVNYGVSLEASLMDMVENEPSLSLRVLITAILVQRETGGNLAEVLDRLSGVLRSRARFERRLRTLTAEGRVSAIVLVLVPFILAIVLSITSPTYLPVMLNDPLGKRAIFISAVLMVTGIFWISRIVRVRV